jgi:hypothetical protein
MRRIVITTAPALSGDRSPPLLHREHPLPPPLGKHGAVQPEARRVKYPARGAR